MNDRRWGDCTEPEDLLWHLRDLASDRLLRLFACASCQLIWPILPTLNARQAVEESERFADGLTTVEAIRTSEAAALRTGPSSGWLAAWAAAESANADAWQAAQWAPAWAAEAASEAAARLCVVASLHGSAAEWGEHAWHRERQSQCAALRDIIGISEESPPAPRKWKQWNCAKVASLAQSIYNNGLYDDLPQLADALEKAGCADHAVLDHCRSASLHVRGCWVLDGLLDKRGEPRARINATGGRRQRIRLSHPLLVRKHASVRQISPLLAA